jgi:copper transport protein
MGRTPSLRAGLVPAALAALALGGPGAASAPAHTRLAASDPGGGAVLSRAPDAVRLRFSEPLAASLSSARVLAPDGRAVAGAHARLDGADPRVMVVRLPPLGRGAYSTLWTAVGTSDPHRARGLVVFRVGPGVAPASATPRDGPPVLAVLLRWAHFALLAALIGALAIVGLVLEPARRGAAAAAVAVTRSAETRLLTLAVACGGSALALGVFLLPLQALVLIAWEPESSFALLGQTRWGRLWLVQEGILATMVVVVVLLRGAARQEPRHPRVPGVHPCWAPGPWVSVAAGLAASLAVIRAVDGHAAEVSPHTALSVAALALHTLAAAVWVGGILALAVGFWPLLRRDERARGVALLPTVWARFGRLAVVSVGLLAVTGLYTAGQQVASVDALITTLYGQGLGAKAVLLAVAGGLGALSAAVVHPALGRRLGGGRRVPRLRTLVAAEAVAGLAIFLAAGLMSSAPPARGPEFDRAAAVPGSLTAGSGDLLVTLSATPNRPGQNVVTAVVASTRRPGPRPPTGVDLRLPGGRDAAPMRKVAPGRFLLAGDQLSASGRSRIDAVVHRRGEPDRTVGFTWTAGSAPRRATISDRPLEPVLTLAAALLALAGAAAAAFALSRRPRRPRPVVRRALLPTVDVRKDPS